MEYRKDINGLRSLAIIGVLFFHFNKEFLPGGFAGVDVFFVISGFLMTKIILLKLDNNNFSICHFYYARAKRIIPVLSALCLICLIIGWLILIPKDYLELSSNSLSSILFYSNYLYASKNSYFDPDSANNLLLHTWSLSVEWQFYIIYPLFLSFLYFCAGKQLTRIFLFSVFVITFFLSIYLTKLYPVESYFTLPSRAWEMLAGGFAFIISEKISLYGKGKFLEFIGIVMVVISYVTFNENMLWPSYNASIPVFGTIFIIIAKQNNSIFLSNKIMQFIGKTSYSIYLIHWPIIVLFNKLNIELNILIYMIITIIISYCMYIIIESKKTSFQNILIFLVSLIGSFYIRYSNGADFRVPENVRLTNEQFQRKYYGGYGYKTNEPYLSNTTDRVDFIIFGDSFAAQYAKSIDESNIKSVNLFFHGCPIMPNYSRFKDNKEDKNCSKAYDYVLQSLRKYPKADVIFASAWDNYKDILIKKNGENVEKISPDKFYNIWIDEIKKIILSGGNRNYYIIGRPIKTNSNSYVCLAKNSLPVYSFFNNCNKTTEYYHIEINEKIKSDLSSMKNVTFIDPNDILCNNKKCLVIKNQKPIYTDGAHLSIYGAKIVFDEIYKKIKNYN